MDVQVVDVGRTADLRRRVLRPSLTPGEPLPGDVAGATAVAALDGDAVIGCAIVFPSPRDDDPHAWQLRAMAVEPGRQGGGVGAAVLAGAVRAARDAGAGLLWCNARRTAEGFYARHGWRSVGAGFVTRDTGLPHVRMVLEPGSDPTSS